MYLAYIDDSGSDKLSPIVVVGAVVIRDTEFWRLDLQLGVLAELLTPADKFDKFEEFHSADLFGGFGLFHGVEEKPRHDLIRAGLSALRRYGIAFIYAAVDKKLLQNSVWGSSDAVDVAFRICLCGVEDWIRSEAVKDLPDSASEAEKVKALTQRPYLVIMDDSDDKSLKHTLRQSFRSLRPLTHRKEAENARLSFCHDDMYFGDSKSSIGIQLADLCAHVMLRRFRDGIEDDFFAMVAPYAHAAKPEPFWEQSKQFMKVHEPSGLMKLINEMVLKRLTEGEGGSVEVPPDSLPPKPDADQEGAE